MITFKQAEVLAAANLNQLGYIDRLNKPSYFYDKRAGGLKFHAAVVKPIRHLLVRTEYTPIDWTYGLNADGKKAYAEYLQQMAAIEAERQAKGETKMLSASVMGVDGYQPDGRKFNAGDIHSIRTAHKSGLKYSEIAKIHGCSAAMIRNIIIGKVYRDIE